mmetsp:Transcript_15053/g.19524  ORF Transcript_15053/g.19524 Transcript_15053/m.19524 type:complete len:157 (+) Transcript_15053:65-535(+)
MTSLAQKRLQLERKAWRKDHPPDFFARPRAKPDGGTDFMRWDCGVPGKEKTDWEGGVYNVVLEFSADYPTKAPNVKFAKPLFHPNVYPNGKICLSIINDSGWTPSVTIKNILVGVQDLLDNPNNSDAAQAEAYKIYKDNQKEYCRRIKLQAKQNTP